MNNKIILPILFFALISSSAFVYAAEIHEGDGSYVVNAGDTIKATNGYQIRVNGAYAPYVAWWYSLALISPKGEFLYNFSHGVYAEVPIYSGVNKTGEIVLYLKATAPDGTRTLTIHSVNNNKGCTPKDHLACMRDNESSAGNVYWVDSCNKPEDSPYQYCNERGCMYSSSSCVEAPVKTDESKNKNQGPLTGTTSEKQNLWQRFVSWLNGLFCR